MKTEVCYSNQRLEYHPHPKGLRMVYNWFELVWMVLLALVGWPSAFSLHIRSLIPALAYGAFDPAQEAFSSPSQGGFESPMARGEL